MNNVRYVVILFFVFFSFNVQAQQQKVLLFEVLEHLEKKYPYRFNYLFSTIDGVMVTFPPENSSFEEALIDLEKQTSLNFSVLNDFVSITEQDSFFLCGYLKETETNTAIANATIQSQNTTTSSDDNGYFQIEIKKNEKNLLFQHLGYKPLKKPLYYFKRDSCATIYLDIKLVKLKQVVLSNYLVEGISKLKNGTFKINVSEFGILPGLIEPDILQTVQALPGIQSVDETVSNINIRGGSNDENLLLWDGIKMYQSGHFFGLVSIFNPKMIDNVTLIKNGSSANYTDGVSGTIEMQTTDATNPDFKASIGINFLNLDAFADVPTSKNSSLQISARKGLSDFYKTPTYDSFFKRIKQNSELDSNNSSQNNSNIEFDFFDTSLRWLYQIDEKNQIRLNFLTLENELKFDENATMNGSIESRQSSLEQISYGGGLFYKRTWSPTFEITLQAYETNYQIKGINENIGLNQRAYQTNKVSETGAKLNTIYKFNNRFSILNGYQFTETQVTNYDDVNNPSYSLFVAEVIRTHDIFSQVKYISENKKNALTAGLRANYIPKFNTYIFEPRLSFNRAINNYLNLEVLGEFKHQVTSQIINLQGDFLGVDERRWQLSNNTNIPVIKSKQASVGLQYNRGGWLINGEGYFKKVTGITSQSQGFQNQYIYSRTFGDYTVYGFDFLLRKQFKNLNTWLSYTLMDGYYDFETLRADEFHTNFDITNTITFGTSYNLNNFKFSGGFNWHSGKPTTKPISGDEINNNKINYELANSTRLKDYLRVDLSSNYQINLSKKIKGEIGFSVLNLLNHNNNLNTYYLLGNDNSIEEVSQSSLGITPNLSFRVSF
ncbi:TonB-dependent receptor plug domain-containing protein [Flavobacteriaceae bacterium SZ-1-7]|uniref:TonB-dependent receptor n=1 Tax=Tamlana sedimenti TaxID=3134126 RepID=UPI003128AC29